MVHISKNKIPDEVLAKIYQFFFEIVGRSHSKEAFLLLIDDVFTPSEKIMIAKRIAIIYLLIKELDQLAISEVLKVSKSTVANYAVLLSKKEASIVKTIRSIILKEKIFGFIDDVFADLLIQPGIMKGHYYLYWDHQRRKLQRDKGL